MTVKRRCCDECFYCGQDFLISPRHEHDHAPIPRDAGGVDTVPACITCHDLKDRRTLDTWPLELYVLAMNSLIPSDFADAGQWPLRWDSMPTSARLVWVKWAAMTARRMLVGYTPMSESTSDWALLLNDQGIPTAQGGREWYASTVRAMALVTE